MTTPKSAAKRPGRSLPSGEVCFVLADGHLLEFLLRVGEGPLNYWPISISAVGLHLAMPITGHVPRHTFCNFFVSWAKEVTRSEELSFPVLVTHGVWPEIVLHLMKLPPTPILGKPS